MSRSIRSQEAELDPLLGLAVDEDDVEVAGAGLDVEEPDEEEPDDDEDGEDDEESPDGLAALTVLLDEERLSVR